MKKVICSECGHVSENVAVETVDIYFPYRRLRDAQGKSICCEGCGSDIDMTIFGEQHVMNLHKVQMILLPTVKENNRIYNAGKLVEMLKAGVKHKNKQMIMRVYDLVEKEKFNWDGLDELFEKWNVLVDTANEIVYG